MEPDFVVYSEDKKPQLIVVITGGTSAPDPAAWATQMRGNLLRHGQFSSAPYFMLALRDHVFLWKDDHASDDRPPDYIGVTKDLLGDPLAGLTEQNLSRYSLEMLFNYWLSTLTDEQDKVKAPLWLYSSGLYDSLKHGKVVAAATYA